MSMSCNRPERWGDCCIVGSGHGGPPVDGRGGQLQIAGVVVGQWGANTQAQQRPMGRGTHMSQGPQVTSVGPKR